MGDLEANVCQSPTKRSGASDGRVYIKTILAVAVALRLGVVWIVLSRYPQNWLFGKAPDLGFLAQSLSSGRGFSSPFGGSTGSTAFLTPGYPAMLGLIFRLFGSYSFMSAAVLIVLQTLFAILTVALIMQIARRLFGAPAANLAGALWAVSLPIIWLPAVPWETSLSILLLIGMIALALHCMDTPSIKLWVLMGAYCGLAMLVNPSLMLALFAILGWTVYQTKSVKRYGPWMCFLVFLAVFSPWPIRNARVLRAFIPLRSNFGYELWQGNHAGATGIFDATLEPLQNKDEYSKYASMGEVAYMEEKSTLAKTYIRSHPREFINLCAKRVTLFWMGTGTNVYSGLVELHIVITSLLGLLGLASLFRQRRSMAVLFLLPLLVFPLPYYITHPDFRFRLVLDPLLTMLAAYAVTRLHLHLEDKRIRKMLTIHVPQRVNPQ
jgi:4-amino-4-deoxy-L-arabinose transferase-like glycosyltransferase